MDNNRLVLSHVEEVGQNLFLVIPQDPRMDKEKLGRIQTQLGWRFADKSCLATVERYLSGAVFGEQISLVPIFAIGECDRDSYYEGIGIDYFTEEIVYFRESREIENLAECGLLMQS